MWETTESASIHIQHKDYPGSIGEICWLDSPEEGSAVIMYHNSANYPPGGVHIMSRESAILEFKQLLSEDFVIIGGTNVHQFQSKD